MKDPLKVAFLNVGFLPFDWYFLLLLVDVSFLQVLLRPSNLFLSFDHLNLPNASIYSKNVCSTDIRPAGKHGQEWQDGFKECI